MHWTSRSRLPASGSACASNRAERRRPCRCRSFKGFEHKGYGALTFEFRLDPAETVRASQIVARRRPFGWTERWALPLIVGSGLVFIALGKPWQEMWLLGGIALALLLLQIFIPIVQRRALRRAYDETPSLRGPQVYEFSETGLVMTGVGSSTTVGWDSIVEAIETKEFFLLYFSKRSAFYLPKRATSDEAQRTALRDLLRTQLGHRAAGLYERSGTFDPLS